MVRASQVCFFTFPKSLNDTCQGPSFINYRFSILISSSSRFVYISPHQQLKMYLLMCNKRDGQARIYCWFNLATAKSRDTKSIVWARRNERNKGAVEVVWYWICTYLMFGQFDELDLMIRRNSIELFICNLKIIQMLFSTLFRTKTNN